MDRPITTLFILMSVDEKISTGASDLLDVDRDFPIIEGLKEGLHQYYEIEQTTDLWSLNTGRVQAKLGAGLGVWGVVNLLEGYGNDNPGAKSQGMKQLMTGGV